MPATNFNPANEAATIALQKALTKCTNAGLNPAPYIDLLTELVTIEIRKAIAEMAEDKTSGGPTAIIMLSKPLYQNIYFSDAGRRAAESLIAHHHHHHHHDLHQPQLLSANEDIKKNHEIH